MDTKGDYPKLLIGDFNAYANEPPIYLLTDSGYSNMVTPYEGEDAYSFVYSGYSGYLDHALAKGSTAEGVSLADSITCVGTWLLNADENPKYDYHLSKYDSIFYYEPTPNRYSDHDPIIIKMCLPVKPDPFR
jgi:predicted extracellular nuclease